MKSSEKLLHKYLNDEADAAEREIVEQWYDALEVPDVSGLNDQQKLVQLAAIRSQLPGYAKHIPLWPRWMAAAVAIVVLVVGLFYYQANRSQISENPLSAQHIKPGKTGATLTLSDGRKIRLDEVAEGEIAKEAGIRVTKTADGGIAYEIIGHDFGKGQLNKLTTARGESFELTLPDKSKVWLNAASELTYQAALGADTRRVRLTGEAYFKIARDEKRPFIVESGSQQVEVLGTAFNVNAYADEPVIRTTLIEGSVKLADRNSSAMLVPGQQATNRNGTVSISTANTALATAWKDNNFAFDRLSIGQIMRMISRWYNVEVVYEGKVPSELFWGSVSRFNDVSEVLRPLEKTGHARFRIEGRTIYVRDN
ncbi:FecR family protein [Pedobacter deserti]|uniref:FecR family protein n=1 Tax=Pedobacter deserti TaxID=2817382 RepID=UPI0021089024|nr:FecR family protein [Pedobacter sp. SYSU D00382]